MALVGFGIDDETQLEYILIRNSWGHTWGEDGFAKMEYGKCGVGNYLAWPNVAATPPPVAPWAALRN